MHHGQVLAAALAWMRAGHEVALATVVRTWGSAPRPVGSQLAVRDDGLFVGSVSGGCVEAAVIQAALDVIANGSARAMEFGVVDDNDLEVGLACGGRIEVDVVKLQEHVIARWEELRLAQRPAWAVLERATGIWSVLTPDAAPPARLPSEVVARVQGLEVPMLWCTGTTSWFALPQLSPLRLIIIGAVHIADALIKMGDLLGYASTLVDPRAAFANPERFPGARVVCQWPQEALPALAIDARTAIVTLSHDPKIDDPALAVAMHSPAFYIGALGSRKTHATRHARLLAAGHREADVARIHGPIGLPIGSRAPAEIAVSIVAQLTQRLRCGRMPRVAAVVLAAGRSTRMGGINKLLHPFEDSTMLDKVVDAARMSRADTVVVVTGHEADRVRAHLEGRRLRFVHNARYAEGISTSIGAGIDAVADADAALILLADMPWVTSTHINTLIDAFGPHTGPRIFVPTYAGRRGNPVLWSRDFFAPLRALLGDRGGKPVIEQHAERVIEVTVQDDGVHRDLDTQ